MREWIGFIDYLLANDFIQIYIEGGEPVYRRGFDTILAHAGRRLMTLMRTNGTLIDRAAARRLKCLGLGRALVDVMGARPETHDYFTGVPGSFEKACAAIGHLVEVGISTDMLILLTRKNVSELPDYLDLAHRLGVPRVGILRLYPLGRAKVHWIEWALSLDEQMAALSSLRPPTGLTIMQSWHPKNRNCCWQSATVNAYGDSIGCTYLREYVNYGNIREMPFLETWHKDPLYRKLRSGSVERSCPDCQGSQGTAGGCRAAAYAFHGRWDAPDPFCSRLNRGIDLRVLPNRLLPARRQHPDPSSV